MELVSVVALLVVAAIAFVAEVAVAAFAEAGAAVVEVWSVAEQLVVAADQLPCWVAVDKQQLLLYCSFFSSTKVASTSPSSEDNCLGQEHHLDFRDQIPHNNNKDTACHYRG